MLHCVSNAQLVISARWDLPILQLSYAQLVTSVQQVQELKTVLIVKLDTINQSKEGLVV